MSELIEGYGTENSFLKKSDITQISNIRAEIWEIIQSQNCDVLHQLLTLDSVDVTVEDIDKIITIILKLLKQGVLDLNQTGDSLGHRQLYPLKRNFIKMNISNNNYNMHLIGQEIMFHFSFTFELQ